MNTYEMKVESFLRSGGKPSPVEQMEAVADNIRELSDRLWADSLSQKNYTIQTQMQGESIGLARAALIFRKALGGVR